MPAPLAYLLTWTTHGTWLHGDTRGSVDRDHATPGTPYLAPDPSRVQREQSDLATPVRTLSPDDRAIVHDVIQKHCDIRRWHLRALNVRSNHIHVVVTCPPNVTPETAMEQFKAWATRRLREQGRADHDAKVWTEHGSTRWINDETSLAAAIDYVLNRQ